LKTGFTVAPSLPKRVAIRHRVHAIGRCGRAAVCRKSSKYAARRRVAHNWYAACSTGHIEFQVVAMPDADPDEPQPAAQRGPVVPSSESIRQAQALREAIRRKLLSRPAPPANPYWCVGAD
jgi:hypothetical protein